MFQFEILSKDKATKARIGKLSTPHGIIYTPNFIPVATQGSIKSLDPRDLREIGIEIVLANTYHLHLRPGEDVVKKFGGLAKFMGWDGITMTDSGGFQVFSLGRESWRKSNTRKNTKDNIEEIEPQLVKITNDGVSFRSHLDGSQHLFTPEESINIQKKLGADIILAFDECAPYPSTYEYTKQAMERTHAWALRSLKASQGKLYYPYKPALYGIVQGGVYKDLRQESARFISLLEFDGIAIGGISVGETKHEMRKVVDWVVPHLPENKPRHLLGIGEIDDIFDAVERGLDTFDCVVPTRLARMGWAFLFPPEGNAKNRFRFDLAKSEHSTSKKPLSKNCACYVCKTFTRGYIHHLFRARELLSYRLITYHNLFVFSNLMKRIRESIEINKFLELKKKWLS